MDKPLDRLTVVLETFTTATGKLLASNADYCLAKLWLEQGIPVTVIQRGIAEKLERTGVRHYVRSMPLSWCEADVRETFESWRRAVGPQGKSAVDSDAAEA